MSFDLNAMNVQVNNIKPLYQRHLQHMDSCSLAHVQVSVSENWF